MLRSALGALLLLGCLQSGPATAQGGPPPPAPDEPVVETLHGVPVVDHYRWMEGAPVAPRLATWLGAQGRYTRARLDALPGRDAARARVTRYRRGVDFALVAAAARGRQVLLRFSAKAPWPRYFLLRDGRESLLLDAKRGDPASTANVDWYSLSPNGRWFAYGVSDAGTERSVPHVVDLDTLRDAVADQRPAELTGWTGDGDGAFFYRRRDDAGDCWLHLIGANAQDDVRVFSAGEGPGFEPQASDEPYCQGAPGSRWILGIHRLNGTFIEQAYIADGSVLPGGALAWRRIAGSADGIRQMLLVGDTVYAIGNGRSPNGDLRAIDARRGDFAGSPVLLAAADGLLETMTVARDGVYVKRTRPEASRIFRIGHHREVEAVPGVPEGQVALLEADRGVDGFTYIVSDANRLPAAYRVLALQGPGTSGALPAVPGWGLSRFEVLRARVAARDGALVPVTLLRRRKAAGPRAVLLRGYGAYGFPARTAFDPALLALVDGGIDVAVVGVRGGGDLGETWHRAGMKANKPNTWRDAIDVGEWLLREGHAARGKLALWGTSAGGIMVGRAFTERPDLWGAAIGEVGLFNMLRFEFTANGPGNVSEFGSIADPDGFRALLEMDSVQAVREGVDYPPILLTTGLNDPRVQPWVVAKFAAALLRDARRRENVWLDVGDGRGHFQASADGELQSEVDRLVFLQHALGIGAASREP